MRAGNGLGDLGEVLIYDASRTDVEVSDFGIAHLSVGQSHAHAARAESGGGEFLFERTDIFASVDGNGVALGGGGKAVAVHNDDAVRFFHGYIYLFVKLFIEYYYISNEYF